MDIHGDRYYCASIEGDKERGSRTSSSSQSMALFFSFLCSFFFLCFGLFLRFMSSIIISLENLRCIRVLLQHD